MLQPAHQPSSCGQLTTLLRWGLLVTGLAFILQAPPTQANEIGISGGVTIRFGQPPTPRHSTVYLPRSSGWTYRQSAYPTAPTVTIGQPIYSGRPTQQVFRGQIEGATLVNPIIVNSSIENSTLINPVIIEAPRSTRRRVVIQNYTPYANFPHSPDANPPIYGAGSGATCVVVNNFRLGC